MTSHVGRTRKHVSWSTRALALSKWVALAYVPAAIGYVIYSSATQTGLMGHLFAFEVQTLGIANDLVNDFVAILLVPAVPPLLMFWATRQWSPRDQRPSGDTQKENDNNVGGSLNLKWGPLLMTGAAISLAACFLYTRDLRVYAIDLGDAPDVVPPRSGFLELKAIPALQFQSSYYGVFPKGQNRVYSYRPLVGPAWAPNRPIHYFLYEKSWTRGFESNWRGRSPSMEVRAADSYAADRIARDFDPSELKEVHVKVGGRLPTIVLQDFTAKGFTVAPDYVVVEHADIRHHEVSIFDRYEYFLVPALLIVGLPFLLGVVAAPFWIYGSLRRKFAGNDKR